MKTCRPFDRMIVPALPTLDVGGQNGTDSTGPLLDGLQAQTEQAMRTCFAVLGEAGTDAEHVAKLTIYLAAGIDIVRLATPQSVATRSLSDRRQLLPGPPRTSAQSRSSPSCAGA